MRRCSYVLAIVFTLSAIAGCAAPERRVEAPPAAAVESPPFEVTLWDGQSASGDLMWREDGAVEVGGKLLDTKDIKAVARVSRGAPAPAVDLTELPEGYGPLDAQQLRSYRERADEAARLHEGTDAVFCLDKGENILREDGSSIYRYHALFLILKDAARSHANISLPFSEGRTRARVLFARVISPDGESRWAAPDAFEVSVPPQRPQFFDKRRRVLSGQAAGAAVGMFVEYAYEYEDYNPEIKDFFFPGYLFQQDFPVLDSVIDIYVPAEKPLNYATRNMPEDAREPLPLVREGFDGYRWQMRDVPPLKGEPFMPPQPDVVPSVHASLYFDWPTFMESTGKFQAERVQVTPEIQKLANTIARGKASDDEKVAAIYHWIQRNINYLSIKASLSSGWAGHPAAETLKNGYGDCTDVANLASSLCRAVEIDAYPAIIKTNDSGTAVTEIPTPDANHAIALVYPDGKPRFIDPTTTDYRYPYFRSDDHGIKAVIYMTGELVDVPVPPPDDNMRESVQQMVILPDGSAQAVEKNTYNGSYEAGVRGYWRSVPPEYHGQVMQQYLQQRMPGAQLTGFDLPDIEDLDKALTMTINYNIPVAGTRLKDLFIFTLPGFQREFPETALSERRFDIVMRTTEGYSTRVDITLPDGYELAGVPDPLTIDGKHLSFRGSAVLSDDARTLLVSQLSRRLGRIVPAEDYADYRKNAAAIAAWTDLKIVLRKSSEPSQKEAVE